ncbi:MAG: PD-(D/E)XK nuclease family transposase [Candidatus Pacearchaeota archaeon]
MLAPLDNQVIFKIAFTDKEVLTAFVKDILGIDVVIDKIETEKKFEPKIGNIDFSYDIFAESADHRVIIEIQRLEFDYHFDRFLHYHNMAVSELQRRAKDYKIDQTVYTIVILTAPYTIQTKTGLPIKDEVLISSADPRDLEDKVVPIYGHKLVFLNPNYKKESTPSNYRDWLDLIYESIHNRERYRLNFGKEAIKKAVSLIEFENLSPEQIREMKEVEGRKATIAIYEKRLERAEKELEQEKQRAEQEKQRAEQEKQRAEQEKQRAEQEKQRAEQEKQRAKQEAKEREKAQEELKKEKERILALTKRLKELGVSIEEIAKITGLPVEELKLLEN